MLSPEDEEIASRFRKMLKMGMPEGAVTQKMIVEEVPQYIQDAVLAPPPAENSSPAGALSAEDEETANRFRKMLKMGMPEGAVTQKMLVEEVPQYIQDAVLASPPEEEETPPAQEESSPAEAEEEDDGVEEEEFIEEEFIEEEDDGVEEEEFIEEEYYEEEEVEDDSSAEEEEVIEEEEVDSEFGDDEVFEEFVESDDEVDDDEDGASASESTAPPPEVGYQQFRWIFPANFIRH